MAAPSHRHEHRAARAAASRRALLSGALARGARYEIRVHFDRDCTLAQGDHFPPAVSLRVSVDRAMQRESGPARPVGAPAIAGERGVAVDRFLRRQASAALTGKGVLALR